MKELILIGLLLFVGKTFAQNIGEHRISNIKFLKENPKKMTLAKLLWKTKALNEDEIYKRLTLEKENKGNFKLKGRLTLRNGIGFKTRNPYFPRFKSNGSFN